MLCCAVLHCVVLWCGMVAQCGVSRCGVVCCGVLRCIVLCCVVLCYAVLCCHQHPPGTTRSHRNHREPPGAFRTPQGPRGTTRNDQEPLTPRTFRPSSQWKPQEGMPAKTPTARSVSKRAPTLTPLSGEHVQRTSDSDFWGRPSDLQRTPGYPER